MRRVAGKVAWSSRRPFTDRRRGILVTAWASAREDSCRSLVWGRKLAEQAGAPIARGFCAARMTGLSVAGQAMAAWAAASRDPMAPTQVTCGNSGRSACPVPISSIVAITVYVALRIAFSTVNDAHPRTPDPVPVTRGAGHDRRHARPGDPATAHGYQGATTDEQQITGWFDRGFGWNLAIATGARAPTSWTSTSTAKPETATPPTAGSAAPDWPTRRRLRAAPGGRDARHSRHRGSAHLVPVAAGRRPGRR